MNLWTKSSFEKMVVPSKDAEKSCMQMGDGISVGYRGLVETSVVPKVSNHLTS